MATTQGARTTRTVAARRARGNPASLTPPRLSIPEEPPKVPRRPPSKGNKRETLADIAKRIPIQVMRAYFNYPLRTAAEAMHISVTTLKRLCRRHGVKRWPHRQISGINRALNDLEAQHQVASEGELGAVADQLRQLHRRREVIIELAFESDEESGRTRFGLDAPAVAHRRNTASATMIPATANDGNSSSSSSPSRSCGARARVLASHNPAPDSPGSAVSVDEAKPAAAWWHHPGVAVATTATTVKPTRGRPRGSGSGGSSTTASAASAIRRAASASSASGASSPCRVNQQRGVQKSSAVFGSLSHTGTGAVGASGGAGGRSGGSGGGGGAAVAQHYTATALSTAQQRGGRQNDTRGPTYGGRGFLNPSSAYADSNTMVSPNMTTASGGGGGGGGGSSGKSRANGGVIRGARDTAAMTAAARHTIHESEQTLDDLAGLDDLLFSSDDPAAAEHNRINSALDWDRCNASQGGGGVGGGGSGTRGMGGESGTSAVSSAWGYSAVCPPLPQGIFSQDHFPLVGTPSLSHDSALWGSGSGSSSSSWSSSAGGERGAWPMGTTSFL